MRTVPGILCLCVRFVRRSAVSLALACALVVALPAALTAAAGTAADRSFFVDILQGQVANAIGADDFTIATPTYLLAADVWLSDQQVNDNGILDGFSGALNWAVYTSAGATPGTQILAGRGIALVATETGVQTQNANDMIRMHFDLEPPVALQPGTYWFALHEGPWGTTDGTALDWLAEAADAGAAGVSAANVPTPASWSAAVDRAFVLYGGAFLSNSFEPAVYNANSFGVSDEVRADDFLTGGVVRLSAADVWMADDVFNDNGLLDSFSGTLGWAIYDDQSVLPGSLVASGSDAQPRVVDTGFQDPFDGDIGHIRIRFGGAGGVQLPALTWHWFALHEGTWGSGSDGSPICWLQASAVQGTGSVSALPTPSPSGWTTSAIDTAWALFDDVIFASGFEGQTACAWSTYPVNTCLAPARTGLEH